MESRKDQCRKSGCPGCRDCLDWDNVEHKKIILHNESARLERKLAVLEQELEETKKLLQAKKGQLDVLK
jgi:hypothetical protein